MNDEIKIPPIPEKVETLLAMAVAICGLKNESVLRGLAEVAFAAGLSAGAAEVGRLIQSRVPKVEVENCNIDD
jgi:hypothetical protein